jgi:hypothetical protein
LKDFFSKLKIGSKNFNVTATVFLENVPNFVYSYGEWEIRENSDEYQKTDAFTIEFRVTVPVNGTKTITYTAENRF